MKTWKQLVLLSVAVLFLVFGASCNDSSGSAITELEIAIEDRSLDSRTMMPSDALLEIHKYSVSGEGPEGSSFGPIISSENSVTVTGISVGNWTIHAKAMNAENNELASGSGTYEIGRGQNSVTLALDSISGTGIFQLDLTWDSNITWRDSLRFDISVEDSEGNVITSVSRETSTSSNGLSFMLTLSAGCHIVSVRAFDEDGSLDVGATDAIRIVSGTDTKGSFHLSPSNANPVGDLSMALENNVGVPLAFYIDYSPKNAKSGQTVTLSALCDSLPSGISSSGLSYQWYKDGVLVFSGGDGSYSMRVQTGLHRYDVIVNSSKAGTMCGASLLLNVSD